MIIDTALLAPAAQGTEVIKMAVIIFIIAQIQMRGGEQNIMI